uniref:holo-[acyl-carrier-protein] synthase n=1 Tax=Moniliophthora roreri TaxID=221103 RepID=A0A0W0EY43_MONRR
MLPLLMMRHRRIPRSKWKDNITPNGKHWIEQLSDDYSPEKYLHSMIGYHLVYHYSLCGMAMTQGLQKKVINIGMGMKIISTEPRGITVQAYIESQQHKLTQLELESISGEELSDDDRLRRLCIILTLKEAYIKAIGQPIGFDYTRLEFNVGEKWARGDNHPLQGWEFRIFRAIIGVARKDQIVEESYQCACAFFRGLRQSEFVFYENKEDLDSWVQFITIDQMLRIVPSLL